MTPFRTPHHTHPQSPEPPHSPFGHSLGIGVAFIVWAVEFKEGVAAIELPFADCTNLLDVAQTALVMPGATFAGVAFWTVVTVSSTVALAYFVLGKFKAP